MRATQRFWRGVVAAAVSVGSVIVLHPPAGATGLTVSDLDSGGQTPASLVAALVGADVAPTVTNVAYTGAPTAAGTFSGGTVAIGFDSGVVLTTGRAADDPATGGESVVMGPNSTDATTAPTYGPGDPNLDDLVAPLDTNDATVLEFDFVPAMTPLTFSYVFGSEEYNEYVNSAFNDVFAFLIGGTRDVSTGWVEGATNCAVVPGSDPPLPVTINNINSGNPFDPSGATGSNPTLYRNNDPSDGTPTIDTELDGLTVVLTCTAEVTPGQTTHVKLAVADTSDSSLDSAVLLSAGSFTTQPPGAHPTGTTYTGATSVQYSDPAVLSATLTDTQADPDAPVAGATLAFTLGSQSTDAGPTDGSGSATTTLTVDQAPGAHVVTTAFAGNAALQASSDTDAFTVEREDCTLGYTGAIQGTGGSPLALSATLGEPDAFPGDRSAKAITFTLTDAALAVTSVDGVTDAGGVATATVSPAAGIYDVAASFAGDAYYLPCAGDEVMVTVADPAAKVTGGGFVTNPDRTSFGFNASSAGGMHGQLQVRAPGRHRLHGYAVDSLVAGPGSATWTGRGRWDGVDGFAFEVSVVDNRKGGSRQSAVADSFSVTVRGPEGGVVFTTSGPLKGGNLTVH